MWLVHGAVKLIFCLLEDGRDLMFKQKLWNNRHEYAKRQTPTLKKAVVNHFENWRTDCAWYAQIQLPPPCRHTRVTKTKKFYERTQGRFRTTDQTGSTEPGYVANGICGIVRHRPTTNKPNGNRRRKIRPRSHRTL